MPVDGIAGTAYRQHAILRPCMAGRPEDTQYNPPAERQRIGHHIADKVHALCYPSYARFFTAVCTGQKSKSGR